MSGYYLIPILCIGGPILVWLFYAADTHLKRLLYVCSFLILGIGGYFAISLIGNIFSSLTTECKSNALEPFVGGDIQSLRVDGVNVAEFRKGIQACPGQEISVYGWIKSKLAPGVPPTVVLCTATNEIPFSVTKVFRPDVAEHENDPDLLESGFNAKLKIPNDLTPAEYSFKVYKKDSYKSQSYVPFISLKINSKTEYNVSTRPVKSEETYSSIKKSRKK